MKKVSVLIPCYNEEQSLPLLYDALIETVKTLNQYEWEMLFINDGSKDETLNVMKQMRKVDKRVCYVDLSRNFGKEKAMLAGFDYVTGDCMIIMDADLQHPPTVIPQMLIEWEKGYDDVYGKRISRGKESFLRKWFSSLFYRLLQKTAKIDILPDVGDFRLLDRSCINVLIKIREQERYSKGLFSWIGFHKKEILFETSDRVAGTTSWNFWQLLNLAIEGITSFTVMPLRISTISGAVVSFLAFLYMIYILIRTIFYGDPARGFPTFYF